MIVYTFVPGIEARAWRPSRPPTEASAHLDGELRRGEIFGEGRDRLGARAAEVSRTTVTV